MFMIVVFFIENLMHERIVGVCVEICSETEKTNERVHGVSTGDASSCILEKK